LLSRLNVGFVGLRESGCIDTDRTAFTRPERQLVVKSNRTVRRTSMERVDSRCGFACAKRGSVIGAIEHRQ
jgi:hypothetical protein